jgi:hypothetical protein
MILRMVSTEPTDGVRLERATRLAGISLSRYGLRDARLRLLSHGFKEVFLVESRSRGRFVLKTYGMPPGGWRGAFGSQVSHGSGAALPRDHRGAAPLALGPGARDRPGGARARAPARRLVGRPGLLRRPAAAALPAAAGVGPAPGALPPNHPPRHSALLRWVPGGHKEDPTADDLSRVGRLAAKLHDHAEGYRPPDASALPRWDWS